MKYQSDTIIFGSVSQLANHISWADYSSIFVLCDDNTVAACLPIFRSVLDIEITEVFVMPAGELNKNIQTCDHVWKSLLIAGADRHSLLINLGGGVVGDLGAFCAATYMRGIQYIQIPTTLLSQVDASVGGKTGIDFYHYKNLIGTFSQALATCIDCQFLKTLPARELKNGHVETLKHALIADKAFWSELAQQTTLEQNLAPLVERSVGIKQNIVRQDPLEKGYRKVLNFGHTIGHALEHIALSQKQDIRHGEAIAFGIIAAAHLSVDNSGLSVDQARAIEQVLAKYCTFLPEASQCDALLTLMKSDKKNKGQAIRFTLLTDIGTAVVDRIVEEPSIKKSILHSIDVVKGFQ